MVNIKSVVCGAVVVMALGMAPNAQAQTMSEALTRIDAIIAEMQKLRAEFARLVGVAPTVATPAVAPTGSVLGAAASAVLTGNLSYGATSDSISRVQKLLATDAEVYADGTVSGFYGPKTQEAVRRFQARFGLDTVGIIGPSTKAVLEAFMQAYPNENYPAGLLKGAVPKPVTPVAVAAPVAVSPTATVPTAVAAGVYKTIIASGDGEDYDVVVTYTDGSRDLKFSIATRSARDVAAAIARRLSTSEAAVKVVLSVKEKSFQGGDAVSAETLIAKAKTSLSKARSDIRAAKADGDDVDDAEDIYDDARGVLKDAEAAYADKDYADAVELAEEVIDLARKAVRAIN